MQEILAGTTVGAITFPVALGLAQNFVFKPIQITCKLPRAIVSVCGGTSIILSGICASITFVLSCENLKKYKLLSKCDNTTEKRFKLEFSRAEGHILIWGAGTLAVFKVFGGKLRHVVPSHLFHPGAFAKSSVPASGKNYAGLSAKRKLNLLGEFHLVQTDIILPLFDIPWCWLNSRLGAAGVPWLS